MCNVVHKLKVTMPWLMHDTNAVDTRDESSPPTVIHASSLNSEVQNDIILPFHFQVVEYCHNGERLASGTYTNGDTKQELLLKRGLMISFPHHVPGYANLDIGPFDYRNSRVRFHYFRPGQVASEDCEWYDHETWKSCGECRAGLWSAAPVDCADPKAFRVKEMDCSLLLATTNAAV
jgi:hypothetical protein